MTHAEAVKAPCPYRLNHIVSESGPGGTIAKYTYANYLGNRCPRWRMARPGDMPRLCAGTGMLDECMTAHNVTDCDKCPDREGYCR